MADRQRPRMIRGCELCRAAHAKCDTQLPSCARCLLLNRECLRGDPFPFRHSNNLDSPPEPGDGGLDSSAEFEFADDQVWVTTPNNVKFVFEYLSIEGSTDESDGLPVPSSITTRGNPRCSQSPPLPTPTSTECNDTPRLDLHGVISSPPPRHADDCIWTPERTDDTIGLRETQREASAVISLNNASYSPSLSRVLPRTPRTASITSSPRHWPLADENEALLLRHFVTKLSEWFDYCDPHNTFATSVVQCAASSPPLLYAILATSARHLSVTSGHDSYVADRYHRECLALLIPILDESDAALDDALFSATVILRLYEEISVPFAGQDSESHLMGTHTFARAQEHRRPSGIRQATFRVVLRQEIVIAFRTQRPVQLLREYVRVDRSLADRTDDWALAFHVIVLCAEVLNYCYGDDGKETPRTAEAWDELAGRARAWMEAKPVQFEPLVYRGPGGGGSGAGVFPEIWLLNDCHVAAHQHYLICQMLLVAHDPRRPQLGPRRAEAVEVTNRIIRDHVRSICGIALSNTHCIPAMFTASMVIGIGGDLFVDYSEQRAMLDILVKTDVDLAWPTASIQGYLREKWGWDA